ncbi:Acyl-CoA N-acyltransferase [Mycena sanguinolenta]|uniref:Acyl-CoA N-acyltransferase n=1 Tax=Mycena sanguinolenta TaxID=230812 RepID=A0A8H6ZLI7_9AGAR|nr:Acyl-CoA N-acyltransferase [Mycena sanguinolenta]
MFSDGDLAFANVPAKDLGQAIEIERAGFPPDEAATLEAFQLRQSLASDLFLGAYLDNQLVGYVCSTLSPDTSLTHESMSKHVPNSSSVCIHSVCVSSSHRGRNVGLKLLREYVARLETAHREKTAPYERILLITHDNLRPFYEKTGFEWVGPSAVVHGAQPWYEMRRILGLSLDGVQSPPQGVFEALQRPSNLNLVSRSFASFLGGIAEVSFSESSALVNKFDLLCPRSSCGSVILKRGVAKYTEAPSVQLEPPNNPSNPLLPALPQPPAATQWWLVTPSAMEFENIGFSRAVESLGEKMKLLACAECDLGPVGWCKEGGTEFWLGCSRVGYRA